MFTVIALFTEISSLRTWCLIREDTCEQQTLELQESGEQKMRMIRVELLATWVTFNKKEKPNTHCLAPEVMCRQNHGVAVDYYALGVIAYECMLGKVIIFGF